MKAGIKQDEQALEESVVQRKLYQDTEYLAQEDTIMNNVLMDYMINEHDGTNVERVYEKLNQENTDKLRKISVNNYFTKTYKEYIHILKVIICLIVIMIPILILNRNEIIDRNMTLLLVVIPIFLGMLYISHRLYLLYMKDDIDFDKNRMPFDREEAERIKNTGRRYAKDSPFKSLGIACIGDECCDASMVYDNLRNKCVAQENFGNYFENTNSYLSNNNNNIIRQNNMAEDTSTFSFLEGNTNINTKLVENFDPKSKKRDMLMDSLKNSSLRSF